MVLWGSSFNLLTLLLTGSILSFPASSQSDSTGDEIQLVLKRRTNDLAQFPAPASFASIPTWLNSQLDNGTWSDVNYAVGCNAQRANWPIQQHWNRIITLASAYTGLNPNSSSNYTGNDQLVVAAKKGMDWWFANDFANPGCVDVGGLTNGTCPCGTPGTWNQNWYPQVILIPQLASTACLLLYSNLTDSQRQSCYTIPMRGYVNKDRYINGIGLITGANTISIMQNTVNVALYTNNATLLKAAYDQAMEVVTDTPAADGIHRDGSFLQHDGLLYNGNYGKDLINAFSQLEGAAIGTSFAANETVRTAFATFMKGNEWMIYVNNQTRQQHWDMNTVGRFIAFATPDLQAISDINFNVTRLGVATADFTGENDLSGVVRRLKSNGTEKLVGNKAFYASDYMVHRRKNFILTNKMLSNRSTNTEQINGANPYGYHLGQGTLFSYVNGYEYRDIQAQWDWNLIPGTTVLLNHPTLNGSLSMQNNSGITNWVGSVSDGWVGTSVMDYIDPYDQSLSYRKAWFYFDDRVIVTLSNIKINSSIGGSVVNVLDNRMAADGGIFVDGKLVENNGNTSMSTMATAINGSTLYYGGNGYISIGSPFSLTLNEGVQIGNWSSISTSKQGVQNASIFSAYSTISSSSSSTLNSSSKIGLGIIAYSLLPSTTPDILKKEVEQPSYSVIGNAESGITGIIGKGRLSIVFWPQSEKNQSVGIDLNQLGNGWKWQGDGKLRIKSDQPAIFLFTFKDNLDGGKDKKRIEMNVSDPGQTLDNLNVELELELNTGVTSLSCEGCKFDNGKLRLSIELPSDGEVGKSVSKILEID